MRAFVKFLVAGGVLGGGVLGSNKAFATESGRKGLEEWVGLEPGQEYIMVGWSPEFAYNKERDGGPEKGWKDIDKEALKNMILWF